MAIRRSAPAVLPRLEPGDRLPADEFDRRYELRPDIHKAELVDGVVYVPTPVKFDEHANPAFLMSTWLGNYALAHPGVTGGNDGSVRLGPDDRVQPDIMLTREGGSSRRGPDGYVYGAPELVVEIAASSRSYDLGARLAAYERAGVHEYIVWLTSEREIRWLILRNGRFEPLPADSDGITRSEVFPGLRLDIPRLLAGDESAILPA